MDLFVLRKNLNLDKMFVGFEERKLFEKSFPGNLIVEFFLHHMLGDFHAFFQLRDDNIPGC